MDYVSIQYTQNKIGGKQNSIGVPKANVDATKMHFDSDIHIYKY